MDDAISISPQQFSQGNGPAWPAYAGALQALDGHWRRQMVGNTAFGVFGNRPSWEDTINRAQALFDVESWSEISDEQASLIAPAHSFAGGDALLGSVGRRSSAVSDFLTAENAAADRDRALALLKEAQKLNLSTIPLIGGDLLLELTDLRGLGRSFATRLLALARPDGFVVVNNKSRDWLMQASGLALGGRRSYSDLLKWVSRQDWHRSTQPDNELEQRMWKIRAALLDAFAYRPWS